jgi:hypothetical protein
MSELGAPEPVPELDATTRRRLERVRRYAWLLDESIRVPFTKIRVGLESLIGLVPVIGDAAGLVLGLGVVFAGARVGVSSSTLVRMLLNLGVEAVLGAVPVIGDVFDFVWKANQRNVVLIERSLEQPDAARRSSRTVLGGVLVAGTGVVVGLGWAAVELVRWIFGG